MARSPRGGPGLDWTSVARRVPLRHLLAVVVQRGVAVEPSHALRKDAKRLATSSRARAPCWTCTVEKACVPSSRPSRRTSGSPPGPEVQPLGTSSASLRDLDAAGPSTPTPSSGREGQRADGPTAASENGGVRHASAVRPEAEPPCAGALWPRSAEGQSSLPSGWRASSAISPTPVEEVVGHVDRHVPLLLRAFSSSRAIGMHRDADHDGQDGGLEVLLDHLDLAEEVAEQRDADRPQRAADDVEGDERAVVHPDTPATIGVKVATIGTKRASTMALAPCFSKNSGPCRRSPA